MHLDILHCKCYKDLSLECMKRAEMKNMEPTEVTNTKTLMSQEIGRILHHTYETVLSLNPQIDIWIMNNIDDPKTLLVCDRRYDKDWRPFYIVNPIRVRQILSLELVEHEPQDSVHVIEMSIRNLSGELPRWYSLKIDSAKRELSLAIRIFDGPIKWRDLPPVILKPE